MKKMILLLLLLWTTNVFAGQKVIGTLEVTGNAGIGSASPSQKLDVIGTAKATRFVGDGSGLTSISIGTSGVSDWGTATSGFLTSVASDSDWTVHGSYPSGCSAGEFVSAIGDTLTCGAPAGSGDVISVGDCSSGACFDGTSDGGTYIDLYDAQGAGRLITGDISAARTWTFPDVTGTVALTTSTVAVATAVADADKGDVTISSGAWAVEDDSHAHTTTSISGIDVSADTNLTAGDDITLTDDDLDIDSTVTRDTEWNGLDFLVGTATGTLSGEIAVGTTPGGELGGTWASPTLDDGVTVANWILTTPNIGIATVTSINKVAVTAPATSATLTIADGKTLTATNTVNLNTMTDGKWCKYTASGTVLNCDQNEPAGSNYWVTGAVGIGTTNSVGIGSTSPAYKLEVQGNVGIGTGTFNAANFLRVNGNVGIGTTAQSQAFEVYGAGAFVGTGNTYFGGNVGIGSASPARNLDVTGILEVDTYIYFTSHYCYASGTAIVCAAR